MGPLHGPTFSRNPVVRAAPWSPLGRSPVEYPKHISLGVVRTAVDKGTCIGCDGGGGQGRVGVMRAGRSWLQGCR